jgi:DNA-binding transcriptional regulator YhcF (GntR family)
VDNKGPSLDIALDRDAEVPLGVQLGWALRSRVRDGRLSPGARLPGLRELADSVGVNLNTVRAVYQRLEQEGLVSSRQGSGTFVAAAPGRALAVADIAERAAREASRTGVSPRDVAAALYEVSGDGVQAGGSEEDELALRRRRLRDQIAGLEQALADLQARRPELVPGIGRSGVGSRASGAGARAPGAAGRLLGVKQLERVRDELVRRLADAHGAVGSGGPGGESGAQEAPEASSGARGARGSGSGASAGRPRPSGRVAPAGT